MMKIEKRGLLKKKLKIKIQHDFLLTKDAKVLTTASKKDKKKKEKASKEVNADTTVFRSYFDKIRPVVIDMKDQIPEVNDFNPLETTARWTFDPNSLSQYRDFQARDLSLHVAGGYQLEVYFSRALEACMSSLMRD